jgi:outer membrane lipoprotein SlyB
MRKRFLTAILSMGLLFPAAAPVVAGNSTYYYHHHYHHSSSYYAHQRHREHMRELRRVGIGAAGGAVVGGLIGGGTGVAVGALAGGGAGYLYNRHKEHEHHH